MTFWSILLSLFLTIVSLECWAKNDCAGFYNGSFKGSRWNKLSPKEQEFWRHLGEQYITEINKDFKIIHNISVYKNESERAHPQIEFYKSLGFKVKNGVIVAPDFVALFENLHDQVDALNAKLHKIDPTIQLKIKLDLAYFSEKFWKQKPIGLEPLSPTSFPKEETTPYGRLLDAFSFAKTMSNGTFIIGGLGNAGMTNGVNQLGAHYKLTPFLHDFAHIRSFIKNPDYFISLVRVYRARHQELKNIAPEQRESYNEAKYGARGIRSGYNKFDLDFWFSEGAWIAKPGYFDKLKQWPLIYKTIRESTFSNVHELEKILAEVDTTKLLSELRDLNNRWYTLFDPLGGAGSDVISHLTSGPNNKWQVPNLQALLRLDNLLTVNSVSDPNQLTTLILIFSILKHSPELSVKIWEDALNSDIDAYTQLREILSKIYPEAIRTDEFHGIRKYIQSGPTTR